MTPSRFDAAAAKWDEEPRRVRLAGEVARAMSRSLELDPSQTLLDYGAGTGLVSFNLLPLVGRVVAADTSREMLAVLREKALQTGAEGLVAVEWSFEQDYPDAPRPDVAVMSMVLHHIADTAGAARAIHRVLPAGGRLAVADLDLEGGSFHAGQEPAEHDGFSRDALGDIFRGAGFADVRFDEACSIAKPGPDGRLTEYTVFLMTARKP